jgi:lipoprotein-anchoring transpeptidase ErfK/SrfK
MVDHWEVAATIRSEERLPRRSSAWVLALALGLVLSVVGAMVAVSPSNAAPAPETSETPAATTPPATTPDGSTADSTAPGDDQAIVPEPPTRAVSYAARLVVPVVIRKVPSAKAKRVAKLQPFGTWNGGPVVLSIAEVRTIDGARWLRVRLPIRPNGSTGWVMEDNVEVRRLRYRIEISRKLHKLTLLRDGKRIGSTRVVIGAPATPTPSGQFAVLEVVRQPKGSVLGPWALHLTAHSNVLDNYGGGPGRVALHGRSGGLLNDPLGTSRSHGCIRMPNAFVARLQKVAVEGTPVVIR